MLILSASCWSSGNTSESLSAHVHGVVTMDVAGEKNQVLVLLKGPAESFLGFETKAKSKEQKTKLAQVKSKLTKGIKKWFGDKTLKDCQPDKQKFQQVVTGKNHSEIHFESYLNCSSPVSKRELVIKLGQEFSRIQKTEVQIIRADGTFGSLKTKDKTFKIKL